MNSISEEISITFEDDGTPNINRSGVFATSFLRASGDNFEDPSKLKNDVVWSAYKKGLDTKKTYIDQIQGDCDDDATFIIENYMKMTESIYSFVIILQDIMEKSFSDGKDPLDVPCHIRETFHIVGPLKKIVDNIEKMKSCIDVLSRIREEHGTISEFERLTFQQKSEWYLEDSETGISLDLFLDILNRKFKC